MKTLAQPTSAAPSLRLNLKVVVLSFIFLALPIFDMVNGLLIGQGYLDVGTLASPSQIGRFFGIVLLLAFTARAKYSPYIIAFFVASTILETVLFFRHNNIGGAALGYANVIRFFYMYLIFVAFSSQFRRDFPAVIQFLKYNVVLICLSIFFASFTGLANSTYGWGAGTKGFFASGNGLGIYIGVATLILAAMKKYGIYKGTQPLIFALSAFTLIMLGTKTSFLMFILVVIAGFWSGRFRYAIIPAIIVGAVRFFTEISEGLTSRFDIILIRYKNSASLTDYILSGRNIYVEGAWDEFAAQNPDFLRWLFGGGAFLSYQNPRFVHTFDTLESDLFDVFFMYGLIGLACYLVCLLSSVRTFVLRGWMLLPIVLLWGHSIFAGHVLFNGLGATLIVMVLAIGARVTQDKGRQIPAERRTVNPGHGSES